MAGAQVCNCSEATKRVEHRSATAGDELSALAALRLQLLKLGSAESQLLDGELSALAQQHGGPWGNLSQTVTERKR